MSQTSTGGFIHLIVLLAVIAILATGSAVIWQKHTASDVAVLSETTSGGTSGSGSGSPSTTPMPSEIHHDDTPSPTGTLSSSPTVKPTESHLGAPMPTQVRPSEPLEQGEHRGLPIATESRDMEHGTEPFTLKPNMPDEAHDLQASDSAKPEKLTAEQTHIDVKRGKHTSRLMVHKRDDHLIIDPDEADKRTVETETHLALEVDPAKGTLAVTTSKGKVDVHVLPLDAQKQVLDDKTLDTIDTTELTETPEHAVVFTISGLRGPGARSGPVSLERMAKGMPASKSRAGLA